MVRSNAHCVVLIGEMLDYWRGRVLVVERGESARRFGEPLQAAVGRSVRRTARDLANQNVPRPRNSRTRSQNVECERARTRSHVNVN